MPPSLDARRRSREGRRRHEVAEPQAVLDGELERAALPLRVVGDGGEGAVAGVQRDGVVAEERERRPAGSGPARPELGAGEVTETRPLATSMVSWNARAPRSPGGAGA